MISNEFLVALRAELERVEAGIRQQSQLADHLRGLLDSYAADIPVAAASEPESSEPEDGDLWRAGLEATKPAPPEVPATLSDQIAAVLREAPEPLEADTIVQALSARGVTPGGHRAAAIIGARLAQSRRFQQVLPGRYALAE